MRILNWDELRQVGAMPGTRFRFGEVYHTNPYSHKYILHIAECQNGLAFNSTKPPLSSSPNSSHSETQSTSLPDLAVIDSAVSDLSDALETAIAILTDGSYRFPGFYSSNLQWDGLEWAVLGGYALGSVRGILPELRNCNTRQLPLKTFMTRLMNSSMKHGSGFAPPAGSIVFIFSLADMIFGKLRAKDDLNAVAAGAVTGGLFRCARGLHASMVGAGIGVFAAFIWLLSDQDSRNRLWEMRKHLTGKQDYSY
uniref:Bm12825, isoform a n=1 Tax=Brugia malayi TaxID=6279 RepID=A0A1I9G5V2_BRUMA|nr:Bm12825, isoform a [Brugia malayi]